MVGWMCRGIWFMVFFLCCFLYCYLIHMAMYHGCAMSFVFFQCSFFVAFPVFPPSSSFCGEGELWIPQGFLCYRSQGQTTQAVTAVEESEDSDSIITTTVELPPGSLLVLNLSLCYLNHPSHLQSSSPSFIQSDVVYSIRNWRINPTNQRIISTTQNSS